MFLIALVFWMEDLWVGRPLWVPLVSSEHSFPCTVLTSLLACLLHCSPQLSPGSLCGLASALGYLLSLADFRGGFMPQIHVAGRSPQIHVSCKLIWLATGSEKIWSLTGTMVTLSVLSCPPRALLHGRGPLGQVHQAISICTQNQLLAAVFVKSDSACVKSIVTQCYPVPDSTCEINYHTLGYV